MEIISKQYQPAQHGEMDAFIKKYRPDCNLDSCGMIFNGAYDDVFYLSTGDWVVVETTSVDDYYILHHVSKYVYSKYIEKQQ